MKEIKTLMADQAFKLQITGSNLARSAVIFVHGFGVKRDSRKMFEEIEQIISNDLLSARGDYSIVQEDKCVALPFTVQRQRLHAVIQYLQNDLGIEKFIYIGHSQGCIPIGLEQPKKGKILLLAPPVIFPFEEFIKTPGWSNKGSHLDINGNSRLVRSDLIIDVPSEFWEEFKLINADYLYNQLSMDNEVQIVFAGDDQILGPQESPRNIQAFTIPGADHDFSSISRKLLLNLIKESIEKPNL